MHCIASRKATAVAALLAAPIVLHAQGLRSRDSAGVHIAENPARMTFPVNLKLGDKPTYDVGGLHDNQPDAEFNSNQGYLRAVRLSNGGLVAIDVNKVKYFDATGKLVKVAGRDGDGPGEFRYLMAICRTRGDTIVVSDRARLGVLDKAGNFVRHIASTPRHLPFDGCFDDGTLLLVTTEIRVPTPTTSTAHLWRVSLDGTSVTSLGDMVGGGGFDLVTQSEITRVAAGTRLVIGDGTKPDIAMYQLPVLPAGGIAVAREDPAPMRLTASIRSADPVDRITDADVDRRTAMTIGNNASAADRADRMDRGRTMPHPANWPAIGRIYMDPAGDLWVADYLRTYPAATGYSKFDATGRLVGRLMIPASTKMQDRLEIISFGRNDIFVRRWDEDGATHLTVYPIVPVR